MASNFTVSVKPTYYSVYWHLSENQLFLYRLCMPLRGVYVYSLVKTFDASCRSDMLYSFLPRFVKHLYSVKVCVCLLRHLSLYLFIITYRSSCKSASFRLEDTWTVTRCTTTVMIPSTVLTQYTHRPRTRGSEDTYRSDFRKEEQNEQSDTRTTFFLKSNMKLKHLRTYSSDI